MLKVPVMTKETMSETLKNKPDSFEVEVDGKTYIFQKEPFEITEKDIEGTYKKKQDRDKSDLHEYGEGPFCKFKLNRKIDGDIKGGLYIFVLDEQIVYIGMTNDFSQRFGSGGYGAISPQNCYKDGQFTNCKINNMVNQNSNKVSIYLCPFLLIENQLKIMLHLNTHF
ncbi:MAG: hypothetical protein ACRC2T_07540 [Thermoguttaceae bacterium]